MSELTPAEEDFFSSIGAPKRIWKRVGPGKVVEIGGEGVGIKDVDDVGGRVTVADVARWREKKGRGGGTKKGGR